MKKKMRRVIASILLLTLVISTWDVGGLMVNAQGEKSLNVDNLDSNGSEAVPDSTNYINIDAAEIELGEDAEQYFTINNARDTITQKDSDTVASTEITIDAEETDIAIKFEGLNIVVTDAPAISINGAGNVEITMLTENRFTSRATNAAICVGEDVSLSINNEGSLFVFGGETSGDGIGACEAEDSGEISISGGTTIAVSGENGTSIGGNPTFNGSAVIYTNKAIAPAKKSRGYLLYQNAEIAESGTIVNSGDSNVYGDVILDKDCEISSGTSMTVQTNGVLTISKDVVLHVFGTLKNEGTIINRGKIIIENNGVFIQNGSLTYSGTIENKGTIYVLSSISRDDVTDDGGIITEPETIKIKPNSGLWNYYGQEPVFTTGDYVASKPVGTFGWSLSITGNTIGKHNFVIKTTDIAGSIDGKIVLAEDAPTFEIRPFTITESIEPDATWYNEPEVELEAPEGYHISTDKDVDSLWDTSITVSGLMEEENAINYYLRSILDDGTKGAIDTKVKTHIIKVDTKAPTIERLEIEESIGDTSAECIIRADEAGTYYYIVLPSSADSSEFEAEGGNKKLKQMVESGQGIKGSGLMDGNKNTVIEISGLTALTEYNIYAIVKDKAGNLSDVASNKEEFTTSKVLIKGSVTVSGTALFGSTLKAVTDIRTANVGKLSYSWYRGKDIEGEDDFEEIENASDSTYKITQEDIDHYICVRVTGENCSGYISGTSQLIPKLIPAYTIPKLSSRTYDPSIRLADIKLPSGWEWVAGDVVPTAGTKGYQAVFTPQDTEIYDNVETKIAITVKAKSLSKSMVVNLKNKQYGGGDAVPSDLYLKYKKVNLKAGTDYTVSYRNNKQLGKATATIKGKTNYKGTIKVTYEIKKKDIKNLKFTYLSQFAYTENPIYPSVTIKNGKVKLKKNSDYVISYTNNTKIGTGKITIKGIGSYKGTKKLNFAITPSRPSLKLVKKSAATFMVDYASVYGGKNYEISYTADKKFTKSKTFTFTTKSNAMTVANLDKNTVYYVKVRAFSKAGTKKIYGPYSKTVKVEL